MNKLFTIKLFLSIIILNLVIGISSCKPLSGNTLDEAETTLELSEDKLVFEKTEGVKTVTVKTNSSKWDYIVIPQSAWLSVGMQNDKLTISTSENNTGEERTAIVSIVADGFTKDISVKQSAADIVFSFSDEEIVLDAMGGDKAIEVISNDFSWTLSIDNPETTSWLQCTYSPKSSLVYFKAERNPDTTEREATLTLNLSNGEKKNFSVKQAPQIEYFLPFEKRGTELIYKELIKFERDRGFALSEFHQAIKSFWGNSPDILGFKTSSKKLPGIKYFRPIKHPLVYEVASVIVADIKEVEEGGGYRTFLEKNGYTRIAGNTVESLRLESPDGYFSVNFKVVPNMGHVEARFVPQILQERDYPTFDKLPYGPDGFIDLIDNPKWKFKEIDEWETKTLGNKLQREYKNNWVQGHEDERILLLYSMPKDQSDPYQTDFHLYQLYQFVESSDTNNELVETTQFAGLCYNNIDLAIFLIGENQYKVTREFHALALSEGFEYRGMGYNGVTYEREKDNLRMFVTLFKGKELFGVDRIVVIRYSKIKKPGNGMAASKSKAIGSEIPAAKALPMSQLYK